MIGKLTPPLTKRRHILATNQFEAATAYNKRVDGNSNKESYKCYIVVFMEKSEWVHKDLTRGENFQVGGFGNRLVASLNLKLLINIVGVLSHRPGGNNQLRGNLFVSQSLRQQGQYLQLTVGQRLYQILDTCTAFRLYRVVKFDYATWSTSTCVS